MTGYADIFVMPAVGVAPAIMVTLADELFGAMTCDVIQPDGPVALSEVSLGPHVWDIIKSDKHEKSNIVYDVCLCDPFLPLSFSQLSLSLCFNSNWKISTHTETQ